jgi:hypothetical protein
MKSKKPAPKELKKDEIEVWKELIKDQYNAADRGVLQGLLKYHGIQSYVVIELEEDKIKDSIENNKCVNCSNSIPISDREDCLFTKSGKDRDEEEALFYICKDCRKESKR